MKTYSGTTLPKKVSDENQAQEPKFYNNLSIWNPNVRVEIGVQIMGRFFVASYPISGSSPVGRVCDPRLGT